MCQHPQCKHALPGGVYLHIPALLNVYELPFLNTVTEVEPTAHDFKTGIHCSWPCSVLLNYLFYCKLASDLGPCMERYGS